jgi:hypothetical protein
LTKIPLNPPEADKSPFRKGGRLRKAQNQSPPFFKGGKGDFKKRFYHSTRLKGEINGRNETDVSR